VSTARPAGEVEGRDWQRLDFWLWCARVMKARSDCARLVEGGGVRLNSQPTAKTHARVRRGDVITLALRQDVRVLRVNDLATRRGASPEARMLYHEIAERAPSAKADLVPQQDQSRSSSIDF
jgi:ribosome-associated heat shock protein Hsp15